MHAELRVPERDTATAVASTWGHSQPSVLALQPLVHQQTHIVL